MLTSSGKAVAASAAVLLIAGIVVDYPELVALGVACTVALVMGIWWLLAHPDLEARREISPARVAEGDRAHGVLTLVNVAPRRSPPLLAVESVGGHEVAVELPSLAPGDGHTARYPLPTGQRGVHRVGPLTMARSDPLRLVLASQVHATTSALVVHPRVHAVEPVPTGRTRDVDGPSSATSPQGGIAFHSLRAYVPGDDLRLVHWRSSARTGQLMVRHNVVPNEPRLMVVLDTSAAPYTDESFEDAVRAAASLCMAACDGRFPLRFRTTGGAEAVSGRDGGGRSAVLAGIERSPDDPGLCGLVQMAPADGLVSLGVVTGQASADQLGGIAALRGRFGMVSVVTMGERLGRPPAAVDGALVVDCTTSDDFATRWNGLVRA